MAAGMIQYISLDRYTVKKCAKAGEILQRAEFNVLVDSNTLVHETSVDLKLLLFQHMLKNIQIERVTKELFRVFCKLSEQFRFLFVGDRTVVN